MEKIFTELGIPPEEKWDVDDDTLVTLHDMSKLKSDMMSNNNKEFQVLLKDISTVLEIGVRIKMLKQ